jgi:epoxyqueuosine reductase
MKAITMLETIRSMLGVPSCAIPLSVCKIAKPYLLEKAGIPLTGTVILFTIPYLMTEDAMDPERNVSLYAVPRDYHGYCRLLSDTLLPKLCASFPAHKFAFFSDHSPIDEVNAAARAGLGVIGQNGLLITPENGTFVFLGEIITDAGFDTVTQIPLPIFPNEPPACIGCGACVSACPSGCLPDSKQNCLSALTQKKGDLTNEEAHALRKGNLVWGCDACQLACPFNQKVLAQKKDTPIPYFREERISKLTTELLLSMSDEEFASRAFSWRGKAVILRNTSLFESSAERRKP